MIRSMNHVGISVANLDRSIEFYRDLLGMEVGAVSAFEGQQYERILALAGAAGRSVMLRHGNTQIEIFEFRHPQPRVGDRDRPVCDHGITHFCIEVSDIDSLYEKLRAAGTRFHCPPLNFFGIARATYGRDPDGNVFELLELPPVAHTERCGSEA